jgi:glycerol-3-phosphate dehydrogenase (NAD(P)+)
VSSIAIGVAGAGAWGTALANATARAGSRAVLWTVIPGHAEEMAATGENKMFLPGVPIAPGVEVTNDLAQLAACEAILMVVPTGALREVSGKLAGLIRPGTPLVACAKGIEPKTDRFVTEIIKEAAPTATPAILSGPSFAIDVAAGLPTAVTIACADENVAARLAKAIGSASFRLYHSTDVRGVEIGGAAKNVLAIAVGIAHGRKFGASAAAALTTRGFAELRRFGLAYGARPETLAGLSGLGDLILTCGGPQSRNFSLGFKLGSGEPLPAPGSGPLAEGFFTAPVLVEMAAKAGVEMPIAQAVDAILAGRIGIDEAITGLLARPQKAEAA